MNWKYEQITIIQKNKILITYLYIWRFFPIIFYWFKILYNQLVNKNDNIST